MASLRALEFCLDPREHQELSMALAKLTQLTNLGMLVAQPRGSPGFSKEDEFRVQDAAADWGRAVSGLKGLHYLYVEPLLLKQINLRVLTALIQVELDFDGSPCWLTQERLAALLSGLAPMQGKLLCVVLYGVPEPLHKGCKAAVASALGDVAVHVHE
jgi:hypothetical protein